MSKKQTAAQAAQQNNRDGAGKYSTKAVGEADVQLGAAAGPNFSRITNLEWRGECEEYATRYAPAPDNDFFDLDAAPTHPESVLNLKVGDRVAGLGLLTRVDSEPTSGRVHLHVDGLEASYLSMGVDDEVVVHDDRVDLSDPDWFEIEVDRVVAESGSDEIEVRRRLTKAMQPTNISPFHNDDVRAPNGRAKINDSIISTSPMHGDTAYEVLGKRPVRQIAGHNGDHVVWEESGEVEYVLQEATTGRQSTHDLRGHGWRRIPAPGDVGISARRVAIR